MPKSVAKLRKIIETCNFYAYTYARLLIRYSHFIKKSTYTQQKSPTYDGTFVEASSHPLSEGAARMVRTTASRIHSGAGETDCCASRGPP